MGRADGKYSDRKRPGTPPTAGRRTAGRPGGRSVEIRRRRRRGRGRRDPGGEAAGHARRWTGRTAPPRGRPTARGSPSTRSATATRDLRHERGRHGADRLTDTPADEGYPAWSPDGRTITFDSDRDGNFDIFAMNADGSNVRAADDDIRRATSRPRWSADGPKIAFMSDRERAGSTCTRPRRIRRRPRRASRAPGQHWFPVFSPDGKTLAFHVGRDVHTASARPVDGRASGDPRRLTTDPANGMYPSWSPDGKRIAFMSWRNGRTEIFTMNATGPIRRSWCRWTRGCDRSALVAGRFDGSCSSTCRTA